MGVGARPRRGGVADHQPAGPAAAGGGGLAGGRGPALGPALGALVPALRPDGRGDRRDPGGLPRPVRRVRRGARPARPARDRRCPDWVAGVQLLGPVTVESLLAGLYDGLRLATIIICVGAANSLANPKRLLKSVPPALYEIGTALVVAVTIFPQLADSVRRVRAAQSLRGGDRWPRRQAAAVPGAGAGGRPGALPGAGGRDGHPRLRPGRRARPLGSARRLPGRCCWRGCAGSAWASTPCSTSPPRGSWRCPCSWPGRWSPSPACQRRPPGASDRATGRTAGAGPRVAVAASGVAVGGHLLVAGPRAAAGRPPGCGLVPQPDRRPPSSGRCWVPCPRCSHRRPPCPWRPAACWRWPHDRAARDRLRVRRPAGARAGRPLSSRRASCSSSPARPASGKSTLLGVLTGLVPRFTGGHLDR